MSFISLFQGEYAALIEVRSHLDDTNDFFDGLLGCFEVELDISMDTMASGMSSVTIR